MTGMPTVKPREPTALCYLLYIPLDSFSNAFSKLQAIADLKKQQEYSKGGEQAGNKYFYPTWGLNDLDHACTTTKHAYRTAYHP